MNKNITPGCLAMTHGLSNDINNGLIVRVIKEVRNRSWRRKKGKVTSKKTWAIDKELSFLRSVLGMSEIRPRYINVPVNLAECPEEFLMRIDEDFSEGIEDFLTNDIKSPETV